MSLAVYRIAPLAAVILLLGCFGQAQTPPLLDNDRGSSNNDICTAFDYGNTIVCNPAQAEFTEAVGQQLLAHMPDQKKPLTLEAMGSRRDWLAGNDIQAFLEKHGRRVTQRLNSEMPDLAPDGPYVLRTDAARYYLTVAP